MHAARVRAYGDAGPAQATRVREVVHGTVAGYKHRKCRCDECREAKRLHELGWRAAHRESVRDRQAAYRDRNRDKMIGYRRKWRRRNPDKLRGYAAARAAAPFDAEALVYCEIIENDPCVYCGTPSEEIDHIIPVSVSRSSDWTNLAPACGRCNSSKGAKSLLEYLTYRAKRAA